MNLIAAILMTPFAWGGDGVGKEPSRTGGEPAGHLLADPKRMLAALEAAAGAPAAPPQVEPQRFGSQEPRPLEPATGRPARAIPSDSWLYFALGPLRSGRDGGWHGLFNTPPLEEALVPPVNTYHVHLAVGLATAEWSSEAEGGGSRWEAAYLSESFEYNVTVTPGLLLGLRVSAGELGGDEQPVRVFEDGAQLVPDGERGFNAESVVARAKWVFPLGFADAGLLAELKVPLSDRADVLTANTVDVGLSGLLTKRWGRFALHLNLGMAFPMGDPDLLLEQDDASPYAHGGVGATWMPWTPVSFFTQLEFNTSAFAGVTLWNEPSWVVWAGGRLRVTGRLFLTAAAGSGLTEESGDLMVSTGVDFTF